MATPRETFEVYNRYRPRVPKPPPLIIPPRVQKLRDAQKWAREPVPKEYARGFLDPTQTFSEKFGTKAFPNFLDLGVSFLEWDPPTETLKPIYTPENISSGSLLDRLLPEERHRKGRQRGMLSAMAEEWQKEFARESVIGESLATSAIWRALPKVLDTESLMIAAPFAFPAKIGSMFLGPTYHALKGLKAVPKPNPYTYFSSTSSKIGGNVFDKATGVVKNITRPLSGELGALERTPKNIAKIIGRVGRAFAEPIIPHSPKLSAGAELYADLAIEASMAAGTDAQTYNDSSWMGAIGTGALTFTGLAAGALSPKIGPSVLRLATKSSDKLMNAMKVEQVYAKEPTREHRSNIYPR